MRITLSLKNNNYTERKKKRKKVNESKPVTDPKLKGKLKRMLNRGEHDQYSESEETI